MRAAIGSCDKEYGALLNGNRGGGLRSCLVKVPGLFLYTKDHARSKMRPLYVKIMVCRPFSFIIAVGCLKKKKKCLLFQQYHIPTSHFIFTLVYIYIYMYYIYIRESVDSLCRDGADLPRAPT